VIKDPIKYVRLLLRYRLRTETELRQRMKAHGFTEEDIEKALNYLRRLGLLSEELLADEITERYAQKGVSSRKLRAIMKRMGISDEIARDFVENYEIPEEQLTHILEKITKGQRILDKSLYRKVFYKLSYLGYNPSEIRGILEKFGYQLKIAEFGDEE